MVIRAEEKFNPSGAMDVSQCSVCKHDTRNGKCFAFPAGIPLVIRRNERDHRTVYGGDGGIQWEPRDGAASKHPLGGK
jgi:hypothetical protein